MATTAIVQLEHVIFQEVANPSVQLALVAMQLGHNTSGPSETRLYGKGNARRSSAPGVLHLIPMTFELVTRVQREMLTNDDETGWVDTDTFLLMRDPRGRVKYGGFAGKSLQITEVAAVDRSFIQVDFAAVSPPT